MSFTFQANRLRAVALGVTAFLVLTLLNVVGPTAAVSPAAASTSPAACSAPGASSGGVAQNGIEVYPSHGKVFYIDSGQGQNVDAAYAGYRVKNTTGVTKTNLWAKVESFTGGVVGLANARDSVYRVGDVSASATLPSFFLLQAGTSTTRAQSHVLRIYSGDPRLSGSSEVYSCQYTFVSVKETIKAAANKVTAVSSVSANQVGGNLVVTVEGLTGTIGSGTSSPDGEVLWFTPAARSAWPSSSLVLTSTQIRFSTGGYPRESGGIQNRSTHANQLVFLNPTTLLRSNGNPKSFYYEAVYTFKISGPVAGSISAIPIAQISSGTQIKHTDVGSIPTAGSTLTISTPVNVGVSKTVAEEISGSGVERLLSYTVTLANTSGAVTLDQIVDDPSAGLTYKAGSARYNSGATLEPLTDSSGNLVFQGPFAIGANSSATLTYQMASSCESGSFSYTNVAYATIGSLVVGRNSSELSGVRIAGSCPPTTGTVTVDNQTIAPGAITQPASSIGTTTAILNGSVDPNGVSGQAVKFEYGTSSSLSGATVINLDPSTTSADFYPVLSNLTGLTPGTRYYFRVSIGAVAGDILSFSTTEEIGTPTVETNSVTSIVQGTGSNGTATFNGTLDPNQVETKASFVWGLSGNSGADAFCTNANYSLSGTVQDELTEGGTPVDVVFSGSLPTQFSLSATGLLQGKYYCVKALGTYATSTVIEGAAVLFRVASITPQTITFPAPSLSDPGPTATLGARTTSPLVVQYSSNTPDVCTVSGDVVTYVSGGICSLSADQPGNVDFSAADTVTISFTVPTFSLTYNINGGNSTPPTDSLSPYAKGATVTVSPTPPTHATQFFAGWNTESNGSGNSYASGAQFQINANTVLYAMWSSTSTYTLTYDTNGGTGGPGAAVHGPGEITLSSTPPTRDGFRFTGWNTLIGGNGTTVLPGAAFTMPSSPTSLYAQWVQRFTVTYNANSATGGASPVASTHDTGTLVTLEGNSGNLTRSGFSHSGWTTTANSGSAVTTLTLSADTTVYARWVGTISYDDNDATTTTVPASADYLAGATVTVQPQGALARTGYNFAGWNTSADGTGTRYAPGATFAMPGTSVLYGEWTSGVTYNSNSSNSGSVPSDSTGYRPGAAITLLTNSGNLSRTNFVFGGWNTQTDGSGTNYQPGDTRTNTGAVVLYARWLDEITITYNGNENSSGSVPNSETRGRGQTVTAATNSGNLARSGYTFQGWSLAQNGGSVLAPGSGTFVPAGNTILYASWQLIVTSGGTNGSSSVTPAITTPVPPVVGPRPRRGPPVLTPPVVPVMPQAPGQQPPAQQPPTPAPTQGPAPVLPGVRAFGELLQNAGSGPSGSPTSVFGSGATLDLGMPTAPGSPGAANSTAGQQSAPAASNSIGTRSLAQLRQETLGGFLPGASTTIEILGARTAARFVVSDVGAIDQVSLIRAIESSVPTQAANFFSIDSVQAVNSPVSTPAWSDDERAGVVEFFAAAGLSAPRTLADLDLASYQQWLLVSARSSTYSPGTQVYLTLTSEPLVLASATVGADGTVVLSGTLPVEFLTAGEHRVRLVGIRSLEGVFVDDEGAIQVTPELLSEIERFDLGTQAMIAVFGENVEGSNHVALRVIPLIPVAPWWTLWLILLGLLVGVAARFVTATSPRSRRIAGSVLVLVAAVPAVILGWLSTVTAVVWWALGLGIAGAVLGAVGPYRSADDRERAEARRSA